MTAQLGTVSEGTLKTDDLVYAFLSALRQLDENHATRIEQEYYDCFDADDGALVDPDSEEAGWLCDALQEALDEYAPDGAYFGAHPGDGALFGYWLTDAEE